MNGEILKKCWFYHDELAKGGQLKLDLGKKPNKKWGIEDFPSND
jgi:putative alpha-1,2-mannosidase